jgi:integrase
MVKNKSTKKSESYHANNFLSLIRQEKKAWIFQKFKINFTDPEFINKNRKYLAILVIIDFKSKQILDYLKTGTVFNAGHVTRKIKKMIENQKIQPEKSIDHRLIIHTATERPFTTKTWLDLKQSEDCKDLFVYSMGKDPLPELDPLFIEIEKIKKKNLPSQLINFVNTKDFTKKSDKVINKLLNDVSKNYKEKQKENEVLEHSVPEIEIKKNIQLNLKAKNALNAGEEKNDQSKTEKNEVNSGEEKNDDSEIEIYKNEFNSIYSKIKSIRPQSENFLDENFVLDRYEERTIEVLHQLATLAHVQFQVLDGQLKKMQNGLDRIEKRLERKKKKQKTLHLRDPVGISIFEKFFNYESFSVNTLTRVSEAQFRIATVIAYATGCRINEIRECTYDDLKDATKNFKLKIIQPKVSEPRDCFIAESMVEFLRKIEPDIKFLLCSKLVHVRIKFTFYKKEWLRVRTPCVLFFFFLFTLNLLKI